MSASNDLAAQASEVVAPAKVLRLATMIDSIVEELRSRPVDGDTRARVRIMYRDVLVEVGSTLSDPLLEELARFHPSARATTDDVLRVDLVLLAGWLRGLRDGLAAAEVPYDLSVRPEPTAA
ncbi:MAG: proteasome activator [Actinomycetota bacterium]